MESCFTDIKDKYKAIKNIQEKRDIKCEETAYVGDDINDFFASNKNMIPFHGIRNNSLFILKKSITTSDSLLGIIDILKKK